MRLNHLALLVGLASLVLGTAAPAADEPMESDHIDHRHSGVRIASSRLHPEDIRLSQDQALVWMNYSRYGARVVFPAEVAKKIACDSKTAFTIDGEKLVSRKIQGRGFASLCKLSPGTYDYQVDLISGAASVEHTLKGRVIVQ